jgi:hypothetical protein
MEKIWIKFTAKFAGNSENLQPSSMVNSLEVLYDFHRRKSTQLKQQARNQKRQMAELDVEMLELRQEADKNWPNGGIKR